MSRRGNKGYANGHAAGIEAALESLHGSYRGEPLCEACAHAAEMIRALLLLPPAKPPRAAEVKNEG